MKKAKVILIIIGLVIAFSLMQLLSYKIALVQLNKPESGNNYKTLENVKEEIVIEAKEAQNVKTYVDVKYPDTYSDFKFSKDKSTSKYNTYNLYSDENAYKTVATYSVGLAYNYFDSIIENDLDTEQNYHRTLLEKEGIINNFDVIDYLKNNYNNKVNIFSSKDEIVLNKIMKNYANEVLLEGSIRYITGDLEGFMLVSKDEKIFQVNLKHEDKVYYFEFASSTEDEHFTMDTVLKFLSQISFK